MSEFGSWQDELAGAELDPVGLRWVRPSRNPFRRLWRALTVLILGA